MIEKVYGSMSPSAFVCHCGDSRQPGWVVGLRAAETAWEVYCFTCSKILVVFKGVDICGEVMTPSDVRFAIEVSRE